MVVVVTVFAVRAVVDVLSGAVVDVAVVVGERGMRGIAYNYDDDGGNGSKMRGGLRVTTAKSNGPRR